MHAGGEVEGVADRELADVLVALRHIGSRTLREELAEAVAIVADAARHLSRTIGVQ